MHFFVSGTDTDVGKTVAAAWLMLHLDGAYWKPVQCGTEDGTDSETVLKLTGFPENRVWDSAYVFPDPLSPHEAALRVGVEIEMNRFSLPETIGPLIVEGAGGLLVPLNRDNYVIDLIAQLALPVILVCRSTLGTINHTLLSLEALERREIRVAGVVLNGPKMAHNRKAIEDYGHVRVLAEIPPLAFLSRETLEAIEPEFDLREVADR